MAKSKNQTKSKKKVAKKKTAKKGKKKAKKRVKGKKVKRKVAKKKTAKKRAQKPDIIPCETIEDENPFSEGLTPQQITFCQLFATQREFFGNGVQSYIEAYNIPISKYQSAATCAGRLLKNVEILSYINSILEKTGFSDEFADKQLSFLMTQNADFKSKLGAIKEFNALKQRVVKKMDTTVHGVNSLTDEQVKAASQQVAKDLAKELKRK